MIRDWHFETDDNIVILEYGQIPTVHGCLKNEKLHNTLHRVGLEELLPNFWHARNIIITAVMIQS